MRWFGSCRYAPDDSFEATGLYTRAKLESYAWRNLCAKIESDAMGDNQFTDLPLSGEAHKLKQDNNHETKRNKKQQAGTNSEPSNESTGQLEIDGDFCRN